MSALESRKVFEELARRIGLDGEEFTAWVDVREAAQLEEEKHRQEQLEFERELEELKQRTLHLKLQLAEVEKAQSVRTQRCETSGVSTNECAFEGCSVGNTLSSEELKSFFLGGMIPCRSLSTELEAVLEDSIRVHSRETGMGSKVVSGTDGSFADVEQRSFSWDGRQTVPAGGSPVPVRQRESQVWKVSTTSILQQRGRPLPEVHRTVARGECRPRRRNRRCCKDEGLGKRPTTADAAEQGRRP